MAKHEDGGSRFRIRLNFFDAIVIVLAILVAGALLWTRLKPETVSSAGTTSIRYTIRLQKTVKGTAELVQPGDLLEDNIKNYELGHVVSSSFQPATRAVLDQENGLYVSAAIPGYYDTDIVVETTAAVTDEAVQVGGGYTLRVGETIYVRGPGYLGSGVVYAIERG